MMKWRLSHVSYHKNLTYLTHIIHILIFFVMMLYSWVGEVVLSQQCEQGKKRFLPGLAMEGLSLPHFLFQG
jgi:hypothetical protein